MREAFHDNGRAVMDIDVDCRLEVCDLSYYLRGIIGTVIRDG